MALIPEKEGWEFIEATRQLLREAERRTDWSFSEPAQRRALLAMADAEDALEDAPDATA
jgi:hypothetical protein